jgi:hypothetical protein
MKKLLSVLFLCTCLNMQAKQIRILFIGNSYTYVNDLPNTFRQLALAAGDSVMVDNNTPGGYTFNGHTTNATTLAKIMLGNWDYVVLQAQSQEPSFSPASVLANTYPGAKTLDSLVKVYNPCAETVFYMTWGRKNGDASNCAFYPPVCTYAGMQQRLRESYLLFSQDNNATCAPVGMAWKKVIDSFSSVNLYQADASHPSIHGTYLTACVFYATIFHKPTASNPFLPVGISNSEAFYMQQYADNTVLDSLENWQQYGDLPFASFQQSINGNTVNFINDSKRFTNCKWYFGDGDSSTAINPSHTYASANNYQVQLLVTDNCKTSTAKKSMVVNGALGSQDIKNANNIRFEASRLIIENVVKQQVLYLYNLNGQVVKQFLLQKGTNTFPISEQPGIYLVRLAGNENQSLKITIP